MIKFFRQSYAIQYVILALLAVAFWVPTFIAGVVQTGLGSPVTPLFNAVERLLGFWLYAKLIFAFLLMLVEALLFNMILAENQIVGKVSVMGAFVFILLMNLTRTQVNFFPFSLSVVFILLALSKLYCIYLSQKPELDLLKAGIFIALASMCYFPAIILILWTLLALPIAKKGSLRLQLIPIMGFLFTYFLYFSGVYLFGDFRTLMESYGDWFSELTFSVDAFNLKNIILLSCLILAAVFLFIGSNNANFEKTVAVRTKLTIGILLVVFAIVLLFFGGNVLMNGLIFLALAIIIAYEFSYLGNTGWTELFLIVFMLLVVANHYYFKLL